jgi:hypothetical protein
VSTCVVPARRDVVLDALRDAVAYNVIAEDQLRKARQMHDAKTHRVRAETYRGIVQQMRREGMGRTVTAPLEFPTEWTL